MVKRLLKRIGRGARRIVNIKRPAPKEVTPYIEAYVKNFRARSQFGLAVKIVADVASFRNVILRRERAEALWAKRSADEIIRERRVYSERREGNNFGGIGGCTDCAQAITAALRAAGLNAVIVRAGRHTYTKFFLDGKVFIADAKEEREPMVREMTENDRKREGILRKSNAIAEGNTLEEIGIRSFEDFERYRFGQARNEMQE